MKNWVAHSCLFEACLWTQEIKQRSITTGSHTDKQPSVKPLTVRFWLSQISVHVWLKIAPNNYLKTPEPWLVITHTVWTTQENAVFINDRTGTLVNVWWKDQTFQGTPSSSVKARKNIQSFFWLSPTIRESLKTSDLFTEHWPTFLSYR